MPRIAEVTLEQVNRQIDVIDSLQKQIGDLQTKLKNVGQTINIADPTHAPATTNNIAFTWTGGSSTLSWPKGFIKDKNWSVQTTANPTLLSTAKGQLHMYPIAAGSQVLTPHTYYWMGWDFVHLQMIASIDASTIHSNFTIHIICQIYTGASGDTGIAGGGGSRGGVDLSGLTYKNF